LVPLDGTRVHDGAVLPVVEGLAVEMGSSLHLLVVVPTLRTVPGNQKAVALLTPTATKAALEMEEQEAKSYLERVCHRLRGAGIAATAEVRRGEAANGVAAAANTSNASLIALSTHGRSGLGALWSGSIGSRILSCIRQPLLLVRIPE